MENSSKIIFPLLCFSCSCIWGGLSVFQIKKTVNIDKLTFFIIIAGLILIIKSIILGNIRNFTTVCSFLILYFTSRSLKTKDLSIFNISIISFCFVQSIYGLSQYFKLVDNDSLFRIVGSFDNPAGFASCAVIGIPFCYLSTIENKFLKFLFYFFGLIIGIAIILSESRAGIVSIISILVLILTFKSLKWSKASIVLFSVSLTVTLFIVAIFLFKAKKESAIGRWLIWRSTYSMIEEHFLIGSGDSSFQSQYMLYQANFFEKHPNEEFAQLAYNINHPFNEYLRILVEYGIIGLLLCVLIISLALKGTRDINPYTLAINLRLFHRSLCHSRITRLRLASFSIVHRIC